MTATDITKIDTTKTGSMTESVRDVFAQVTRYPLDILDPSASLEEDLGIDSVKLGEIFAVLREKYALTDKLVVPRENLRSIETIAESLREFLVLHPPVAHKNGNGNGNGNGHHAHEVVAAVPEALAVEAFSTADFHAEVRNVFGDVTRYPLDILEPHANLEEDLGIDSVKLGEVFAVLREKYALPAVLDLPRERMTTIAGIAESLEKYVMVRQAVPPAQMALRATNADAGEETGGKTTDAAGLPDQRGAFDPDDLQGTDDRRNRPSHPVVPVAVAVVDFEDGVRGIFAEVTRYPLDILDPSASLEEDLGIDSVKLGEVFAVLRERFNLPETLDVPRESMKSIGAIAEALKKYVAPVAEARPFAAQAPLTNGVSHTPTPQRAPEVRVVDRNRPFEGKIALVTGSGRALGKDVAVYLASLGATVIVNSFHSREQGVKTVEEIKAAGGKAIHAWGSVANPQHVEAIFETIEKTYGGLDFFVSNASNGMLAKLEDLTPDHFEKAYRTNVIGLHQCAMRALHLMKKRGGGKIITLSSPASHGYVDYFACMGTVKAAVESLTKSMAIEFAKDNVLVNCVSPGPIYGDLLNKWPESKRLIAEWEQATVCDRLCEDRDVSHFIGYLLQDEVKLFTGSVLVMDGGISVRWGGSSGPVPRTATETTNTAAQNANNLVLA
jgi:enoyl-[acyl-carrier protein] reductase III